MPDILVAIPTFRRPKSLARLLDAIAKLDTKLSVCVLVADNDADGHEGFDLCRRLRVSYRFPLDTIVVPERGIAQVRNALVERALDRYSAPFIAMIDDDEWPSPDWLDQFLRVQKQTGADALQGSVLFARAGKVAWTAHREGVRDIRRASGPTDMLQGAGNLLISRACLAKLKRPCFDPDFALSGGEDRDFFVRLAREGFRFAWADEAIAHGDVPDVRLGVRWALARAYAVGNTDMRVVLKHWPGLPALLREWAKIVGAFVLSPLLFVLLALYPNRRVDALALLFRAAGKAAAMFGLHATPYSVTHGE